LSRKNNINTDHYKTEGRGRQGEGIVHNIHKQIYTQARAQSGENGGESPFPGAARRASLPTRLAWPRRAQRLKRSGRIRGLSAKQLMERRMRQRHELV
jgi:hypothetical protein